MDISKVIEDAMDAPLFDKEKVENETAKDRLENWGNPRISNKESEDEEEGKQ